MAATAAAQGEEARPGLVVVAPRALVPGLDEYVAAREATHAVELAVLEEVLDEAPGADAPERLKRHLHAAWAERGARYVLLVGDASVVPVRFMALDRRTAAAHDVAFYASDHYYADVAEPDGTFDDWNDAREGHHAAYFGEVRGETHKDGPIDHDGVSYAPELAVGRWPVRTADEARAVAAKTLAFEAAVSAREGPPEALLVHADGWVDARERLGARGDALERGGFAVDRRFHGHRDPTPETVRAALLDGVTLAAHVGHGTNETWDRCLGAADRDALAGAPPALYVSVGCSTAHLVNEPPYAAYRDVVGVDHAGTNAGEVFDAPPPPPAALQPPRFDSTGLGERLVRTPRGGAVAYVGCVTGAQPCALTLLDGFLDALAESPDAPIGDAWNASLARYVDAERLRELEPTASWYPPSVFFQGMKFVLLGDPTVRVAALR